MNQRQPRLHDPKFLAWLRTKPCACGCGRSAPSEAAHLRSAALEYGKSHTGMQEKPSDFWAVPLAALCHRLQHHVGETKFWTERGINPFDLAIRLYREYGGRGGRVKRKRTTIKPRLPKEQRRKIQRRGFR